MVSIAFWIFLEWNSPGLPHWATSTQNCRTN